jgi:transaldolase
MKKLKIKIYADGANITDFKILKKNRNISGFTTNPSLMRAAGVKNYVGFANQVLKLIKKKPVSFEIFADDKKNIEKQANLISTWGKNVYVKIPIINTKNKFNDDLIGRLNNKGVKVNVTAVFTVEQTKKLLKKIGKKTDIIISIFAGRIADSGVDPAIELKKHVKLCKKYKNVKILWASVREPFNLIQANDCGCHIITVPPKILDKLKIFGKNLNTYSQETVKDFYLDAKASKYKI